MDAWTKIFVLQEPKLEKPILVQGLPGLGFVGKLAVNYLIDELKLEKFAELYSTYLTLLDGNIGININADGTFHLPKFEFYRYQSNKPNAIFLTGDTQPNIYGQYEVTEYALDFVQKYGCQQVIALGGFQTPVDKELEKVYGVYNNQPNEEALKKLGVNITKSGSITGSCGTILGLSDQRKISAFGLLGATKGEYPDMKAAKRVLEILGNILNIKIDMTHLDTEIENMKHKIENLHKLQSEALGNVKKEMARGPSPFYV